MKSILKIATLAAAAIALTTGTAFAGDLQPMRLQDAHGHTTMLLRNTSQPGATIGFFSHGRGLGEGTTWRGWELTKPVLMHDAHGRDFVTFQATK